MSNISVSISRAFLSKLVNQNDNYWLISRAQAFRSTVSSLLTRTSKVKCTPNWQLKKWSEKSSDSAWIPSNLCCLFKFKPRLLKVERLSTSKSLHYWLDYLDHTFWNRKRRSEMELLVATGLVKKAKCQNAASQYSSVSVNWSFMVFMAFFQTRFGS